MNKKRKVVFPRRFKEAENTINLLIKNGLTPSIVFDFYGFKHTIPVEYKNIENNTVVLTLFPEYIESMVSEEYYLNVTVETDEVKSLSIPFDLIRFIGCKESEVYTDFIYPNIDIEEHKNTMTSLRKLNKIIENLKLIK